MREFLKRVELVPNVGVGSELTGHPAEGVASIFLDEPRIFSVGNERILRGRLRYDDPGERARFESALSSLDVTYFYESDDDAIHVTVTHPAPPRVPPEWRVNLLLFVVTTITTLLAGAMMSGEPLGAIIREPWRLSAGVPFSAALMGILAAHEFGHYIAARRYGLHVTLPFFIPAPLISPIGTLGAVIRMRTPVYTRRMLLDVGAAGPLAGMAVAIPVAIYGIRTSPTLPHGAAEGFFELGEPLLFRWLIDLFASYPEATHDLFLNPVAFAGWIGLLLTALNMLPIGQLDGGHVVFALFGRRQHLIGRLFLLSLVVMGYWWSGWFVWVFLILFVVRVKHPPILEAGSQLGPGRQVIGWLSLVLLVVCFTPVPFSLG